MYLLALTSEVNAIVVDVTAVIAVVANVAINCRSCCSCNRCHLSLTRTLLVDVNVHNIAAANTTGVAVVVVVAFDHAAAVADKSFDKWPCNVPIQDALHCDYPEVQLDRGASLQDGDEAG